MAKQSKIKQTDYTTGGRDISNTAIPMYQENLKRVDEYLQDPQARMNQYMQDYYSGNQSQSDFLTNYNRAMANKTAQNYSATNGGYSSSGQQAYDDNQRYWNDLASRLQDYGVQSSYNMAAGDYRNMLLGNQAFQNAYSLGKDYSDIEQYNDLVDQSNKNWWSGALSGVGSVLSAIPTPVTQGLGAGLSAIGTATAKNTNDALNVIRGRMGAGNTASGDNWANSFANAGAGLATSFKDIGVSNPDSWYGRVFNPKTNK